jgi:hypothetical protein
MSAMEWCEGGVMLDRIAGVETFMVSTGVTTVIAWSTSLA